jgi:hypothetical protein
MRLIKRIKHLIRFSIDLHSADTMLSGKPQKCCFQEPFINQPLEPSVAKTDKKAFQRFWSGAHRIDLVSHLDGANTRANSIVALEVSADFH